MSKFFNGDELNDFILMRFRPFASSWFSSTLTLALGVLIFFGIDRDIVDVSYWKFLLVIPVWIIGLVLIVMSAIRIIALIYFSRGKEYKILSHACTAACIGSSIFWGQIFFGDLAFREDYIFGKTVHLWLFLMSLWNVVTVIIDL